MTLATRRKIPLVSALMLLSLAFAGPALAEEEGGARINPLQRSQNKLEALGKDVYGDDIEASAQGNLLLAISNVISIALGLVGVVFLIQTVYAGFLWMTARGDEKMVTKAKDTIQRNVIGMIIVLTSYAITSFVFSRLIK